MENISYPLFVQSFNDLYNKVNELTDLFDDLSSVAMQSCICADEKPFESMLDSDDQVKSKFDALLTSLEDYRIKALKAYSSL